MRKYIGLCIFLILLFPTWVTAQGRVPLRMTGIQALVKTPNITPVTSSEVIRRVLAAARQNFTGPADVLQWVRPSLVQISLPGHDSVLGTGFVLRAQERLWVAMPYHLGGWKGGTRTVHLHKKDGSVAERDLTITLNGYSGWHSQDVSLAELPQEWEGEVIPLELAVPDVHQPVYSFGYVAGKLGMDDVLPVKSNLLHKDGVNILRRFHVPGATEQVPVFGNGYCGSPLVQWVQGAWKAVGMHNGHCMDLQEPSSSVGSAVNLFTTLPQLIDAHEQELTITHGLVFRGWEITRLQPLERVDSITIERADPAQEPVVRYLYNFAGPYTDEHTEYALEDLDLQSHDKLTFTIMGRDSERGHIRREVSFVIP